MRDVRLHSGGAELDKESGGYYSEVNKRQGSFDLAN
jgi:hypothetical protein